MIKDRIRELRTSKGLTLKDFAGEIGVSPTSASLYESGKQNPGKKTIARICEVFGVDQEWLTGEGKKLDDQRVASEIEVKKTARQAGRKVKEAVTDFAASDTVAAAEIEAKKTMRSAGRKAKAVTEMAAEVVGEQVKRIKASRLDIIIQSPMGGSISTQEIADKVPEGTDAVYVRVDENKLYWVKGSECGDVNIW